MIPLWFTASLFAMPVLAGASTPDRAYWFGAFCMSIPALMFRNGSHGVLIGHIFAGFLNPPLWLYFICTFAPLYLAYVGLVRLGMIMRKTATQMGKATGIMIK